MKSFIMTMIALSLLSGCAHHMGKGCCATGKGHQEHHGHKDCGPECTMEKTSEKTAEKKKTEGN